MYARVLNQHRDVIPKDAVYIGRPSKWGNLFPIDADNDRHAVIRQYALYLRDSLNNHAISRQELLALDGKHLVCHGDVLKNSAKSHPTLRGTMTNQPNTPPITGAEKVTFNYRQKDNKTGFDILLALDQNHYDIGFSLDDDDEADNVTRLLNASIGIQPQQAFIPVVFDFQLETRLNRHRLILHTPICSFQTGILLSPDEESTRKITWALNRKTVLDPRDHASVIDEAIHREFGPGWKARRH